MFNKWVVILALLMSLPALAFKEGDRLTDTASAGLSLNPKKVDGVDFFAEWCVSCRHELPEMNLPNP